VIEDYRFLSLSLKAHPMSFLRARLEAKGIAPCAALGGGGALASPPGPRPDPQPRAARRRSSPSPTQREGTPQTPLRDGARVAVAGLVLIRQRPGTASGVIFMTIEDETGIANIVVWPKLFEKQRAEVIGSRLVAVTGRVQIESGVVHVIAQKIEDMSADLRLIEQSRAARASSPAITEFDRNARPARLPRR
jgi:error-prone DNA polymerase